MFQDALPGTLLSEVGGAERVMVATPTDVSRGTESLYNEAELRGWR